ncbi:MAG TPA: PIG-L deacetylase family protein [Bacillota bacterium]|nr:PIG-L deacetylase family protein [Bacillota bacterium]
MFSNVLVLAPHADDAEFGCGGTIAKFLEANRSVHCVVFSANKRSIPPGFGEDALKQELMDSMQALGIPADRQILLDYQVRDFPGKRQEILDTLIQLKSSINPDLVILPSLLDIHQDHQTIVQEGVRAFKDCTLLGYEEPWNNLRFDHTCFIKLEERHLAKKLAAIKCYRSQAFRYFNQQDFLTGLARVRGTQIKCQYAELFQVIRLIIP